MRALVSGANRGLGLEFVRQLLARGARVIAACRHPGRAHELTLQAAAHPGHLHVLPLDLGKPATIAELAREAHMLFEGLDLLVNNAGMLVSGERFGSLEAEALEASFRTNAVGQAPRVANVSSVLGSIAGVREFRTPSYAMSKAALNMATVQLAQALAPQGVSVVALHPGWARTDMGGAQAEVDPAAAVAGMLRVIEGLVPADTGSFRDWQGRSLSW
jgi:NAD(P)-dependent dehydrogenase (short-subunit alcohol dehydrogenase family)